VTATNEPVTGHRARSLVGARGYDGLVTNPFDDPDANYLVLVNDEGQHSLWPVSVDVPKGWETVFGAATRQDCLDHIEKSWTDMRPKSLIAAIATTT
jgi:MbtH protein